MRFTLIDKITHLEPNAQITAIKGLSLAEEYLQDHFPRFPVMPGVLMLEALTQTSAWLIRHSEDFAHSIVMLKEARNVKYADFVEPGEVLEVTAEIIKTTDNTTTLKTKGTVAGQPAVSARLVLERFNVADRYGYEPGRDASVIRRLREEFSLLYRPVAGSTK
jgi:3-hydroxyacyl-[acyl-carrier-protein] dehydratase